MTWTDERVDLLRKDWADGLSASQIAGHLGGCTRNAVIGKAHRLGLAQAAKPRSVSPPRVCRILPPRIFTPRPKPPEIKLPPDQSPCAVTFLQLSAHHCRWPIGNGPFVYCGARHIESSPYCQCHHSISYTKPERRSPHGQAATMDQSRMASNTLGQPQRATVA